MSSPNAEPLAQDFVVVAQVPDAQRYYFHNPNLTRLDDGTLVIAAPQRERKRAGGQAGACYVRILRSHDGGRTWEESPSTLPYEEATPFVLDGRLLMSVQTTRYRDFQLVSSDDGGRTWTEPQTIITGPLWNISSSMAVVGDDLYWAMDHVELPDGPHRGKAMLHLDRKMSPLDPKAWRVSNVADRPDVPEAMMCNVYPGPDGQPRPLRWLEPNTVCVGGRVRVFARCMVDKQASAHVAAVLDYDCPSDRLSFTQFASWPGGQCKFFIIDDKANGMYWMLGNLVTNSQDMLGWGKRMRETGFHGAPGNERRWLFLHYSIDCLNWFPAGCVARWPNSVHRSFMYPSAVVDGDDLIVLSRTSRDSGDQHDADLCTIHRVRDFRGLAMDLHTGGLGDRQS